MSIFKEFKKVILRKIIMNYIENMDREDEMYNRLIDKRLELCKEENEQLKNKIRDMSMKEILSKDEPYTPVVNGKIKETYTKQEEISVTKNSQSYSKKEVTETHYGNISKSYKKPILNHNKNKDNFFELQNLMIERLNHLKQNELNTKEINKTKIEIDRKIKEIKKKYM